MSWKLDLLKSLSKRSTSVNDPQLKIKNQIIAYHWTFGKDSQQIDKIFEQSRINYDTIDYGVTVDRQKVLYQAWWKLTSSFENYIMEWVRSPSPEIYDCYLKNIFSNLLSNTFSDFIPDMGVTDHRHYDR